MEEFDCIVIGSGPAGYVAAIKAAQLGLKTACIEKEATLGGACLNVGCIPSKALLDSSEKYTEARLHFKDHGIDFSKITLNLEQMMARKSQVVSDLTKGIQGLFKKNKVQSYVGEAKITSTTTVEVPGTTLSAKNIIIATGSKSIDIPGIKIDEEKIVSSTGALSLKQVPKKMIVLGGGYIGLEMASVWVRLGAEVQVIEFADSIVPAMDKEISKLLARSLTAQGITFTLSTKLTKAQVTKNGVQVEIEARDSGANSNLDCDILLVAVGRKPYADNLGCKEIGIAMSDRGDILVNETFQTSVQNIYAIGDIIRGPMLAHKAEEEGVAVAEIIAGQKPHINYATIPAVIYTSPEVATVGKTEEQLKAEGVEYAIGKFPFLANGRAKASGATEGLVKILADKKTDRILGVHIIGPSAGTLIAEAVIAMEYDASSEDIARIVHAHPTLNEAVKEAALATFSKSLHF